LPRKSNLPKGVTEFYDKRLGRWRVRFRAAGRPTYYFKSTPGTDAFREELAACRSGKLAQPAKSRHRIKPGTVSALIAIYYETTDFLSLAKSTQVTYRGILERFRERYGHQNVRAMRGEHVRTILARMKETPAAANNLLDRLRVLMELAIDEGWRNDNPCARVKAYRIKSPGFHTWSESDIAQYEARHPAGSTARRAMYLMLYLGQRRSDVINLGRQHITNGYVRVWQQKTSTMLEIPLHPDLAEELDRTPEGQISFLLTDYGKPYSGAGIGNRMRKWCDQAGLPNCTAHGLRKAAARRLAEGGSSNQDIKSITGHRTDKEVARYTAAADQRRRADRAVLHIGRPDQEQKNGSREK